MPPKSYLSFRWSHCPPALCSYIVKPSCATFLVELLNPILLELQRVLHSPSLTCPQWQADLHSALDLRLCCVHMWRPSLLQSHLQLQDDWRSKEKNQITPACHPNCDIKENISRVRMSKDSLPCVMCRWTWPPWGSDS